MGPIYGEGDSLITLLSLVGMPPQRTYVFLGCYFGLGFGKLSYFSGKQSINFV